MDRLINLPFQGVMNAILHIIPRRCHWAELIFPRRCHWAELTYGFQPNNYTQKTERYHWTALTYGFQPYSDHTQKIKYHLWAESRMLIQPNGNALGRLIQPNGNALGRLIQPDGNALGKRNNNNNFRPERAI